MNSNIHPTALLSKNSHIGGNVKIGPYSVIEEDVSIGDYAVIDAQVFVGRASVIGQNAWIYPHVTIRENSQIGNRVIIHSGSVIGSDGFGYETINGTHLKIPQTGTVCIEDDVEIGSNVSIDRGRFNRTLIKKGTKIDNLVQIAHNVVIGPNSLIVSQAGISGSTELGKNVIVAGQAGLIGHITIGDYAIIGAGAGVSKPVPAKAVVLGSPAKEIEIQKKLFALINRLPDLYDRVRKLEEPR